MTNHTNSKFILFIVCSIRACKTSFSCGVQIVLYSWKPIVSDFISNSFSRMIGIQIFDLLEHWNLNFLEFQFQFNWSLPSSKGNFLNNVGNLFLTKRFFFSGEGKDVTKKMTNSWKETTM